MKLPRISRSAIAALSAVALVAACSSDDDAAVDPAIDDAGEVSDISDGSADAEPAEGGADTSDSGGEELPGSLVVSGAVEESFATSNPEVQFRAGGACVDGTFAMSMKVDRGGSTQFDVVVETDGVDRSTSGPIETEFEVTDFDLDVGAGAAAQELYRGNGTLTIFDQQDFALSYGVDGTLTSREDDSRQITIDFDAVAPINCD